MLLEFRCSNHKSIKDEVLFSMIAGTDDSLQDELCTVGSLKVLPSAVVYGANGSGKSNFLNAIFFMANLVTGSILNQPGQNLRSYPHKLSLDNPCSYSIHFIRNGIRYAYGFSLDEGIVKEEYLYHFPNGRQTRIFERDDLNVVAGTRFRQGLKLGLDALKENRLFLSCAANFTNIEEIENAFLFFSKDLVFFNPEFNNWAEYSARVMQDNPEIKRNFLRIMQAFGTGIKDVSIKLEKAAFEDFPEELPRELRNFLKDKEAERVNAKVIYDEFNVDISEESAGIRRLFQLICPMLDILESNKVLICDEFETALHESIIYQIVNLFRKQQDGRFAQLLFSTHDTNLLDQRLFRRDQIWFTQLAENRSTDLYSLAEIRNVRKTENLAKGYMSGKYGAIPMLNKAFAEDVGSSFGSEV